MDEQAIRRDEREKCCKDVCEECRRGNEAFREEFENGTWWHKATNELDDGCEAEGIRERAYRDEVGK